MRTKRTLQTTAAALAAAALLVITGCDLIPATSPLEGGGWELSGTISEELTLPEGSSFSVTDTVEVAAPLTIEPGVTLEFAQGTGIWFNSDGSLFAEGTAEDPITFTGTTQTPGWWNGVYIHSSDDLNNIIDHAVIEYAGREAMHSSIAAANLAIGRSLYDARIRVTNTTIRHSKNYGVTVHSNGKMPDWSGNTITENGEAALVTTASNAHYLDGGSSYTGNEIDAVEINGNDVNMDEVTWQKLNVPYHFHDETVVESGTLTIAAGATLAFAQEGQLEFRDGSEIIADGSSDSPITFTATQETPGWWYGIHIYSSDSVNNLMDHIIVEYGGRDAMDSSVEAANLAVGRSLYDARVEITNSQFNHSDRHGVYVNGNGTVNDDLESANSFSDNANSNVVIE